MAPPIPGTRRPVPVRRRSAGDMLIGLLAVVALAALTAGVPFALVTIFGLPIPHSMPSMSILTHQLDAFAVIKVLMVLVWLAWIQLVFCVIVEIRAAVRNAGHAGQGAAGRRHPDDGAPAGDRGPAAGHRDHRAVPGVRSPHRGAAAPARGRQRLRRARLHRPRPACRAWLPTTTATGPR